MEQISAIKTNQVFPGTNSIYTQRYSYDVHPENELKNLSYIDSRCLAMLSPATLLELLSKQISNPKNLVNIVDRNPALKEMLVKNNLKVVNGDLINFLKFTDDHMKLSANIASLICDNIKSPVNKNRVVQAARLHDLGKLFIPYEIINKPNNLTEEEKHLMALHPELGYQLLHALNFDEKTLELIRNHHNINKTSPIEQQIVSAADVYSALIENRPYKSPMHPKQAIGIIEQIGVSKEVTDALNKVAKF